MRGWENNSLFAGSLCVAGPRGGWFESAMRASLAVAQGAWIRHLAENRVGNRPFVTFPVLTCADRRHVAGFCIPVPVCRGRRKARK